MVEERRKFVRDRVKAKAWLQHSGTTAQVVDINGRGVCLQLPRSMKAPLPEREVIQISSSGRKQQPCQLEAELKWNEKGLRSVNAGFEIRSMQSNSCNEIFASFAESASRKQGKRV